jgi:hypothetical protein
MDCRASSVPGSDDICMAGAALEIVDVTDTPALGDSQLNYIYYGFLARRPDATGDSSVYIVLEGPESADLGCGTNNIPNRVDDLMIQFDYDPQRGTTVRTYSWGVVQGNKCEWIENNEFAGGNVFEFTTGKNNFIGPSGYGQPFPPTTLNGGQPRTDVGDDTFYEFAINLTAAGIVPENRCVNFTGTQILANAGNSLASAPKDNVGFADPVVVDNCNSVRINKVADFAADDYFIYMVSQRDDKPVHGTAQLPPEPTLEINGAPAD